MDSGVGKKLNEVLSGIDKGKLNFAKRSVEEFISTKDGQKLKEELKGMDKDKLINSFMKMDTDKLKDMLGKANLSGLSGKDLENILKKLK